MYTKAEIQDYIADMKANQTPTSQTPTSALVYVETDVTGRITIDLCGPVGEDENGVLDTITGEPKESAASILRRHGWHVVSSHDVETAEGAAMECEIVEYAE